MISVGEDDFGAELFERILRQRFDGSRCPYRQEKRRLDYAVRRR